MDVLVGRELTGFREASGTLALDFGGASLHVFIPATVRSGLLAFTTPDPIARRVLLGLLGQRLIAAENTPEVSVRLVFASGAIGIPLIEEPPANRPRIRFVPGNGDPDAVW